MKRNLLGAAAALAVALTVAGLLAGCGSGTKTVSIASAPPVATQTTSTAATTGTATTPTPTTTSTPPAQTTTNGGTAAPTTTRTAAEPAFTEQGTHAEGASAAAALVRGKGYTPDDTSEYHENQTLQVLVGTRTGSSDGYGQQAFFFLDGHYIGTDAKEPSATVKVLSQSDTEVTLAYPLYRRNDPLANPSGGQATVHFQLNNGKLTALGTIPPANSTNGLSRN